MGRSPSAAMIDLNRLGYGGAAQHRRRIEPRAGLLENTGLPSDGDVLADDRMTIAVQPSQADAGVVTEGNEEAPVYLRRTVFYERNEVYYGREQRRDATRCFARLGKTAPPGRLQRQRDWPISQVIMDGVTCEAVTVLAKLHIVGNRGCFELIDVPLVIVEARGIGAGAEVPT